VAGVFIALMLVAALFSSCSGSYGGYNDYGYETSSYTESSTVRTKLDSSDVSKTGWYTDEDGDWVHTASKLTKGLEHFYDKTGVQPYVYILKNGSSTSTSELNEKSQTLYDELFSDEGHFLLVFCDDGNGSYNCGYTAGSKAATVMDSEAISTLQIQLELAYATADSDEEVFSDAFYNTADSIMAGAENQATEERNKTAGMIVGGIVVVGAVVFFVVRQRKKAADEKRKRADEILNTPLEKFGTQGGKSVEDLASKYEGNDANASTSSAGPGSASASSAPVPPTGMDSSAGSTDSTSTADGDSAAGE
jgi:hypothetical protein